MRGAGEVVEVQGGHVVRPTGRKDRHSKVCTAKGPRDRRVRLAAHTAIQFYDVQDRLGYDRPSKAVDWLIQNAKAAIADLAELPAWYPTAITTVPLASNSQDDLEPSSADADHPIEDSYKKQVPMAEAVGSPIFVFGSGGSSAALLPTLLDSDAIANTIKSFFPIAASASSSAPMAYQNYPPELISRTSRQDLRLSLQSFQGPIFHHPNPTHHQTPTTSGSAPLPFDTTQASWPEQSQGMVQWNVAEKSDGCGGYVFTVPPRPQAVPLHSVLGQSQFFSQRGPLQSNNLPSIRAWTDPMLSPADDHMHPELNPWVSTIGFASADGFSGFHIPARIQGEAEHYGLSDQPSSTSDH